MLVNLLTDTLLSLSPSQVPGPSLASVFPIPIKTGHFPEGQVGLWQESNPAPRSLEHLGGRGGSSWFDEGEGRFKESDKSSPHWRYVANV